MSDAYPDLLNNLSDLRLKAHVQHAIGLVKHEVSAATQVCFACFQ